MEEQIRQIRARKQSQAPDEKQPSFICTRRYGIDIIWASVNLGTWICSIEKPIPGSVYTKRQCLRIIKKNTTKGSGERAKLIDFMVKYDFVPSKTGLYTLLRRNEMGIPIKDKDDDNWGMLRANRGQQDHGNSYYEENDTLFFEPCIHAEGDYSLGRHWEYQREPDAKERKLLREIVDFKKEYVRSNLLDRKGWKGHLRFDLHRVRFCDEQDLRLLSYRDLGKINMMTDYAHNMHLSSKLFFS